MISVCIPTYNGEEYIREQLASILSQISLNDEVIISDDGSTDRTLEIVRSFSDSRLKIFNHEKKVFRGSNIEQGIKYVSHNLQHALSKASGDVIYLADQDDIWLDDRVSSTIGFFNLDNPDGTVVVCDCIVIDEKKNILNESYLSSLNTSDSICNVIYKNPYLGCCMCFDRKLLRDVFPFPSLPVGHDMWIGLVAKLRGKVIFSKEKLVLYRRHLGTVTTSGSNSKSSTFFKIKYRFGVVLEVLKKWKF